MSSAAAYPDDAFTPGPWHWDGAALRAVTPNPEGSAVHTILEREGGCGYLGSDWQATLAELDADFTLIAAVTELLDAARKAEQVFTKQRWLADGRSLDPEAIALVALRSAIAKATGRPT